MNLGVVCYASWLGLPAPPHLYQLRTEEDGIHAYLSRVTEDKCRALHLPGDLVGPLISPLLTHQDPFSLTHRKQCSFMKVFLLFKASMGEQHKIIGLLQTRKCKEADLLKLLSYKLS